MADTPSKADVRTVVIDAIAPEGITYLREHGFDVRQLMKPTPEMLAEALADCEALVTRSSTAVTAALLERAPRLRIVGPAGAGVDNIAAGPCSRRARAALDAPHPTPPSPPPHTPPPP